MSSYDVRRQNLRALRLDAGSLVQRAGYGRYTYWRDMLEDDSKSFGERAARKIEQALGLPANWLDQPHPRSTEPLQAQENPPTYWTKDQSPKQGMAQPMSPRAFDTPPSITWEELMQSKELPEVFVIAMPDESMAPRIERGTELIFATTDTPSPGKGVLVRDQDGQLHVRRYRQGRGSQWQAQAVNEADFEPLDSERDGLAVVAVLRGVMSGRI